MCGICGIVSKAGAEPPDHLLLQRMMGRMRHRGPDGSGWYRDSRAALGHTRLAIIDVAGGAQPLGNEEGTLWISFNGEIFNYVEISEELAARGHVLRTRSDTEVIVHAFEEWGERCFERFNGQWAVALWDSRARRLVLCRDRMGVRPLHWAWSGGSFLFASEIKALFADPRLDRRFDPAGLAETFTFWCPVAPRTAFAGVQELEPGHCAVLQDGRMQSRPYWSPTFPPAGTESVQDLAENGRMLRERLVDATRLRFLRSDVPVGAYLSGGIDSSVTAAIIARYTGAPLSTFSLRFTDPEFDEGQYQQEMAMRLGTEHHTVHVSAADIGRVFPEVVRHAERPILRTAPAPLYLLSRLVRESGYKVVVTGEGADEVLAGYDIFREAKVRMFWTRDTSSRKRQRIVERLYPWMKRSPGAAPSFAQAFFSRNLDAADPAFSHRPRWDSTAALASLLTEEMRAQFEASRVDEALLARMPSEASAWDPLCRAQWLEMKTLLPGYILSSQGDRMLMANSVEGRFPFLDPGIVDFSNGLPARHKLLALDEKHILKREFADLVPDAILHRPKQPYRSPDAASFFCDPGLAWVDAMVAPGALAAAGIFDPAAVALLMKKCRRVRGETMGNTDNMRLLAVLSTMLAHDVFVAGDGGGGRDEGPPRPMIVIDTLAEAGGKGKLQ
jgi:asparagine synthase (glutamine-hydrolysing)